MFKNGLLYKTLMHDIKTNVNLFFKHFTMLWALNEMQKEHVILNSVISFPTVCFNAQ